VFVSRRFRNFCSAHGAAVSMLKLRENALGVKGVTAFQNEAPLVKLNVVAAYGTAAEIQRCFSFSFSMSMCANAAANILLLLYFLYVFFIF
jgi:hypothetical protein